MRPILAQTEHGKQRTSVLLRCLQTNAVEEAPPHQEGEGAAPFWVMSSQARCHFQHLRASPFRFNRKRETA